MLRMGYIVISNQSTMHAERPLFLTYQATTPPPMNLHLIFNIFKGVWINHWETD